MMNLIKVYEEIKNRGNEFETERTIGYITGIHNSEYNRDIMKKLIQCGLCKKRKCIINAIEVL